jgi:triacylglycerol lipase
MPLEPRPLPPETVDGLRPPRVGFPYFAHADQFPFEPHATTYSAANAWWLADAAFLAYGDAAFIEAGFAHSPLPRQGYRLDWLGTAADNRGMVLTNDETIVVVLRGTRLQVHTVLDVAEVVLIHQHDFWIDRQFLPAVYQAGGRVHGGFLKALEEISGPLDALLQARRPEQRLWFTGHSLGGALATLAAAHAGVAAVHGLHTYGAPLVGDAAFASILPTQNYFRFVHRDDWVACVPPQFLGYQHAGTLRAVTGSPPRRFWDDVASATAGFASAMTAMANELRVRVGDLPFKIAGIADHAPIYYATLLWNELLNTYRTTVGYRLDPTPEQLS